VNNRGQLREDVGISLGRIWVMAHGDFNHCQPNRPHIRGDGVSSDIVLRFSSDTLRLAVVQSISQR